MSKLRLFSGRTGPTVIKAPFQKYYGYNYANLLLDSTLLASINAQTSTIPALLLRSDSNFVKRFSLRSVMELTIYWQTLFVKLSSSYKEGRLESLLLTESLIDVSPFSKDSTTDASSSCINSFSCF